MGCLIVLNDPHLQASLNTELFFTDFADQLSDAYQDNPNKGYPDPALIVSEINKNILPKFVSGQAYDVASLMETINHPSNKLALRLAYSNLLFLKGSLNLKAVPDERLVEFDIVSALLADLKNRELEINASIKIEQDVASTKNDAIVLESIGDYGNYVHERNYKEYKNYAEDRFKGSKTVERMVQSKFFSDAFLKNVYIDTDRKVLVDQTENPQEQSEIDANLKNYRTNLLKDMIARVTPSDEAGNPVAFHDEMLTYKGFQKVLRSIADRVISTTHKGTQISLDAEGTLFQLAEENKINPTDETTRVLNNFVDFTILADFNKMFDYYAESALAVSKYNDDFNPNVAKYTIKNALSVDAINASWDEKVQDAVNFAAPLYKAIINNTPIVNYTTGRETAVNLYPTQVQAVFAPFFAKIDRHNPTESLKDLMMSALKDPSIMRTDKNVIYTMYKKFFERVGDQSVVQHNDDGTVKSNFNNKVNSFYETIRNSADQSLMYLITKPLMESSKVFYLEAIEENGVNVLTDSAVKQQTQVGGTTQRAIMRQLNKPYEAMYGIEDDDNDKGFIGKYEFKWGTDNIGPVVTFNSTVNGQSYSLRPSNNDNQDVRTLRALAKDMLGFDFDTDRRYAELWEELLSLNGPNDEIPSLFTGYLYDALQVVKAKDDLYNPTKQELIAKGEPTNNVYLDNAIARATTFNSKYPERFNVPFLSQNAEAMNELIYRAINNYTGNQLKSIVNTVEGTQVAGYSTYNYFNGIKQNHADIRAHLNSAGKPAYDRSVLAENLLINDESMLNKFYIRGAAKVGSVIKNNASQNVLETANFNINLGYFGRMAAALKVGVDPTPVFDVTVYSDKSINPLPAINNKVLIPSQGYVNLFTTDSGSAQDVEHTIGLHYKSSGHYYRAYANNILDTWRAIYGASGNMTKFTDSVDSKSSLSEKLNALNDLNENKDKFWYQDGFEHKLKGYAAARFYANKAGVVLNNWVDFDNSAKTIGPKTKLTVKKALIDNIALFDKNTEVPSDGFRSKLNKELVNFVNELAEMNFKLDGPARDAIQRMYPNLDSNFQYDQEVTLTKNRMKATNVGDINPALAKMFHDYNLIQDNLMLSTLGPVYAHKGTNENKMWITQIKRNVAATASIKNYSLGLEKGVEDYTTTAFVDELQNFAKTVLGDNHDIQSFDGASFETMTQRLKTWHSLNYRFNGDGGEVHKSFISHFDPKTGAFAETKHAAFAMTYDFIRQSKGANIDLFELHKDLYRGDISKVDITNSWRPDVNLKAFNDVMYLRRDLDFETGRANTLYKLNGIKFLRKNADGNSEYEVTTQNISAGEQPKTVTMEIPTFYELWKILGDIDTVEHTDEKTAHFYFDDNVKKYLRANVKSAEKLLDFESYIGNTRENIIPEKYVTGRNDAVEDGYKVYQKLFGTRGFVSSHENILEHAVATNLNKEESLAMLASLLKGTETKLDAHAFANLVQNNKDELQSLVDHIKEPSIAKMAKPYQRFKGSNVDRISMAGAQKVGQFNLNHLSTMHTPSRNAFLAEAGYAHDIAVPGMTRLITHPISNFNAGIQLSAWHETEGAHVTTPTQMLNALIFNAKRLDKVNQMYEAIGSIVDNELNYVFNGQNLDIPNLVKGLSNAQFYKDNKDKLLTIFKDIMRTKVSNSSDDEFTLESLIVKIFDHKDFPIDDSQIFPSALAELTNYFTKSGIRTKFDGMFAIIHPASDTLQFHDVQGGFVPIRDDRGGFTIKPLEDAEIRTMQMHEYSEYRRLNDYLSKSDTNENNRTHAAKATSLNAQPRNLRGQQVQIKFTDGTSQDLTILNGEPNIQKGADVQGGTHLIPEAHALDLVKRMVGTFKKVVDSDVYAALTDAEKPAYLDKQWKDFLKKMDSKVDKKTGLGGLIQNHPAVLNSFQAFNIDLANSVDLKQAKDSKQHIFEWAYENFSQSKTARDRKIKGSTGEKLVFAKEHEFFDKLNTVGTVFLKRLQVFLDHAENGYENEKGETSFIPASLHNPELYANADKLADAKIEISRAECIAPITAKKSFQVREGDSIGDITADLMYKRLLEGITYLDVNADAVLLSKYGKQIFLHTGSATEGTQATEEHPNIEWYGDKKWFVNDSGERLFQVPEGMNVTNINGDIHVFLNNKHPLLNNSLLKNLNSGFGRQGDTFTLERLGDQEARNDAKASAEVQFRKRADEMYASWQVYLKKLIGTRVPGQHFQSFQGMKIVGFSASVNSGDESAIEGNNNIYVADEVILLSGADFDIDKQNIIYHSILGDGTMATWHPASNKSTEALLEASLQLPMPSGRQHSDFAAELDQLGYPIDRFIQISDNADMTDVYQLLSIYHMLDKGFKIHPTLNPNVLDKLVEYDNAHKGLTPSHVITTAAIRNFAISNTNQIIESPSNFVYLSTGVSTDTIKQFSSRVPRQKTANDTRKENPVSQARQKYENMMGKAGIGIMASSGMKAASAITYATNKAIFDIAQLTRKNTQIQNLLDNYNYHLNALRNPERFYAGEHTEVEMVKAIQDLETKLNNNKGSMKYLQDATGGTEITLPNLNYDLMPDEFNDNDFYTSLHRTSRRNQDLIRPGKKLDYAKIASMFDPDMADSDSQLLSSATDNAKELDLGKLNGTPDLLTTFPASFLNNVSLEEITDQMTSRTVEMLIRNAGKDVFDKSTSSNSMGKLLQHVATLTSETASDDRKNIAYDELERLYNLQFTGDALLDTKTGGVYSPGSILQFKTNYYAPAQFSTLLAKYLGINQGLPSDNWGMYSFATQLQDTINGLFDQAKSTTVFNFKDFLDSLASGGIYHKSMIAQTSELFRNQGINFNPLFVLSTNPHFAKQLTAFNSSNTMLRESSYRVSSMYHVVDKLRKIGYLGKNMNIKMAEFGEVEKYIESKIIRAFINNEYHNNEFNVRERPVFFDGDDRMELNNHEDREKFLTWVESKFIDNIKKLGSMQNNTFIQDLTIDDKQDPLWFDKVKFAKLNQDTTNVKNNLQQGHYRDAYIYSLKQVYDKGLTDLNSDDLTKQNNVFNTLFWYNLIVNKNNITKNSYAKLLGDVLWKDNQDSNIYSRLLLLKGKIGKSTNVELNLDAATDDDKFWKMSISGIELDLKELALTQEIGNMIELPKARVEDSDEDQTGTEGYDDEAYDPTASDYSDYSVTDNDGTDIDTDAIFDGDQDETYDDPGDGEVDAAPREKRNKLTILREKRKGDPGTNIILTLNKESEQIKVNMSTLSLPEMGSSSMNVSGNVGYNPWIKVAESLRPDQDDAYNYHKMSIINIHDLLSRLSADDITVTYKVNGETVTEKFDPTKDYKC